MLLLRIRLPSGVTERVTLQPSETLQDLGSKINDLGKLDGQFSLYSDPKFTVPFVFETASKGDMVFIKGTIKQPQPVPPPTTTPVSTPPVGRVLSTAAPDPTPTSETTSTSTTAPPPTATPDKDPSSAPPSHPNPALPKRTPQCRHNINGMCGHCVPTEDKRDRLQSEVRRWNGRGSSLAVMEAEEALKTKISAQDAAHASAAAVNSDAAQAFQAYLTTTGFSQQRIGFCYGTVTEDATTTVHAIYEPPQRGGADAYALIDGDEAGDISKRAERLAELLDLRFVGIVFSARPRNCILSAMDVVFAASMAAKLPEELRKAFVVLIVTTTETGQTVFEAYQISDLAIDMFEGDIFEELTKQKPNGGRVACKADVLVEGKDARKVHTEFFLLNVPIKSCDSWLRTVFAIENRDIAPQSPSDIQKIVNEADSIPYEKRLADFHLLLFLSNIFDMKSDMPALTAAIKDGKTIDEGFRLMIENMGTAQ